MSTTLNTKLESFLNANKYYARCAISSSKTAALRAFAPATILTTCIQAFSHIAPECLFSDPDYNDPSETFIIYNNNQLEKFISFYKKNGVEVEGDLPVDWKNNIKSKVGNIIRDALNQYKKTIEDLNAEFNTSVKLSVNIPETGIEYAPAEAYGGTMSFTDPLINCSVLPQKISLNQKTAEEPEVLFPDQGASKLLARRKFVLTHEFIHILNNDSLTTSVWKNVSTIISLVPWITDFSSSTSWGSYIFSSLTKSFLIEGTSEFFYKIFARNFEKRADIEAMKHLKTNVGAIEFFSSQLPGSPNDFNHPPLEERLRYARHLKAS